MNTEKQPATQPPRPLSTTELQQKKCDKCKIQKSMNGFRKYTDRENSYSNTCKVCLNEADKQRKINLRRKKNETFMVKCEKCNEEKALKCFAKLKKFYKKRICLVCYPKFLTAQKTEWCKKEHNSNMNYRLKKSLAARLRTVLVKNDSTMNYIGCNIQYLREWFEYNFTAEMTWENYGTYWSIDHIIPVSKFDLEDEMQKKQCWNWSNMMPVTVAYNSTKGYSSEPVHSGTGVGDRGALCGCTLISSRGREEVKTINKQHNIKFYNIHGYFFYLSNIIGSTYAYC